jgi:hypothetical protein
LRIGRDWIKVARAWRERRLGDHRFDRFYTNQRRSAMKKQVGLTGSLALVLALLIMMAGLPPISAKPAHAVTNPRAPRADFDGDGYGDLAVGVPFENLGSPEVSDAGTVNVIYGSWNGLSDYAQTWNQDNPGVPGSAEENDYFGRVLAAGDFDGNGRVDLAIGVPFQDVLGLNDAGAVNVLYGSGNGFSDGEAWYQGLAGVPDALEAGDRFGSALAVGDFDGDGYDDLAIGSPYEDIENGTTKTAAGAVHVLYGSSDGLTATEADLWHQDVTGFEGTAAAGEWFGYALAAGDFDGDGKDDLAIGVPYDGESGAASAGLVNLLYGSEDGLSVTGDEMWHQGNPWIEDDAEIDDRFGYALTAGDYDRDGYDDLVVGVPYEDIEDIPTETDAGGVNVLYGTGNGLSTLGNQFWSQDDLEWTDAETDDLFGFTLATGDFDGDHRDDLVVGSPFEEMVSDVEAGAVHVMYGSSDGLAATGNQIWHQDSTDIEDEVEAGDRFGYALAAGDFNEDGNADLAIGVPQEDIENGTTVVDAGVVHVIYGSSGGLTRTGDDLWQQNYLTVDTAEAGDMFGFALAALYVPRYQIYLPGVLRDYP